MAFGIDTLAALNDPDFNWANFKQWKGEWPSFVGRYFGGDQNAITGEFSSFKSTTGNQCQYVLPIQACVQANQQQTGSEGLSVGASDAETTLNNLKGFLGELAIPDSGLVYVYLDVEPNVRLTPAYWSGWANAIRTGTDSSGTESFRPALYCQYVQDSSTGLWGPNSLVAQALNDACTDWPGYAAVCYGLWPAQPEDVPASCVPTDGPDWSVFSQFSQNLCGTETSVPVLVYQYIEGCLCVEDGYTDFAGLSNSSKFMPCGTTSYPNNNLDLDGTDSTGAESYMLVIS